MPNQSAPRDRDALGFSSSICDLFSDPSQRSNCCAITCCGLFISDRTNYLALGTLPQPWWKRLLVNILFPLATFGTLAILTDKLWASVVSFVVIIILLVRRQNHHIFVRRAVMERICRARREQEGYHVDKISEEIRKPHFPCFCYRSIPSLEEDEYNSSDLCTNLWNIGKKFCCGCCGCWCQLFGICAIAQEDREMQMLLPKKEFQIDYITFEPYCDYFRRILSLRHSQKSSFIEHVSALSKLSLKLLRIFSVGFLAISVILIATYQPMQIVVVLATFSQAFLVLYFIYWRWNRFDLSFDAVIKYFASGFILCTGLALAYELLEQIIFIFVFLAIFVLASIATTMNDDNEWNDFNVSEFIQAHMKLSGFLVGFLSFILAFLVAAFVEEMAKYYSFWMVEHPDFLSGEDLACVKHKTEYDGNMRVNELSDLKVDNIHEIKHVKDKQENSHPDLHSEFVKTEQMLGSHTDLNYYSFPPESINQSKDTTSTLEIHDVSKKCTEHKRTLVSTGTAIMIAMVTTSLGFACCENFIYIYIYTPSGISNKLVTLAVRSLLPIHPIAAALQSIGVIRRDVEGDKSYGLGWIIFPAVLLHGSYDFALMLFEGLQKIHSLAEDGDNNDDNKKGDGDTSELMETLVILCIALAFVFTSITYYIIQSRLQKIRITNLDQQNLEKEGSVV